MRVVYYTFPSFLDASLPFIRELSRMLELHVLLQISPEARRSNLFDLGSRELSAGIKAAEPILLSCFPAGVEAYWRHTASFNLVVYDCTKSLHPATWKVSYHAVGFIQELQPDLVHINDVSLRLAWAMRELRRDHVVVDVHDPTPHAGERNWRTSLARRLTYPHVQRFILHSHSLQGDFRRRYRIAEHKTVTIPLGVYDVFREWTSNFVSSEDANVLFFGRLSQYKGIETLYQAAPLVAEKVPNVRFVVAGRSVPGYQLPSPPTLPRSASMEIVQDYIPTLQLVEYLQTASVVVCPYSDATQSGVIMTSYALGKPVVATRVGGLSEYVEEGTTGLLVPPGDPAALAAAIVSVLTDPRLRNQLRSGLAEVQRGRLNWTSIAERTLQVYRDTISET